MSHIYQPVMLEVLFDARGARPDAHIAAAFFTHDESQIDYYAEIGEVDAGSRPRLARDCQVTG